MAKETKTPIVTESVDGYLDLNRAGQEVVSEGSFTMSAARALEKMTQFQLENPSDYLRKILQAAHCLCCESVNFKLGVSWEEVQLTFVFSDRVSAENLANAAVDPTKRTDPAVANLAIALTANLDKHFKWKVGPGHILEGKNGKIECLSPSLPEQLVTARFSVRRCSFLEGIFSLLSRAEQHKAIYDAGRFSTLDIRVDSRAIEKGWPIGLPGTGAWYDYMSYPYCLMEGYYPPDQDLAPFEFPQTTGLPKERQFSQFEIENNESSPGALYRNKTFSLLDSGVFQVDMGMCSVLSRSPESPTLYKYFQGVNPGETVGCAFALPLGLKGPSQIRFLIDGVSTEAESAHFGVPGLLVVASGEGLKTDFSGLSVVKDEAHQKRLKALKAKAENFWIQAKKRGQDYHLLHWTEGSNSNNRVKLSSPGYAEDFQKILQRHLS